MTRSPRSLRRLVALATLAVVSLAACGGDDETDSSPDTSTVAAGDVEITGAWARTSPSMASMGAAYMTIASAGGDRLLGASVDASIAAAAEVHEVVMEMGSDTSMSMGSDTTMAMNSGEMTMREVESVEIPAGESVVLQPGGYHVMLIDLVAPLEVGSTFDVVLTFETAGDVVVTVEVRDDAP